MKKTRYKVLFPFEARCEDELTINPGDEVLVRQSHFLLSLLLSSWFELLLSSLFGYVLFHCCLKQLTLKPSRGDI